MENIEIRDTLKKHGLRQWQLAKSVGIAEATLCCWLRDPLQGERAARVQAGLAELTRGRSETE